MRGGDLFLELHTKRTLELSSGVAELYGKHMEADEILTDTRGFLALESGYSEAKPSHLICMRGTSRDAHTAPVAEADGSMGGSVEMRCSPIYRHCLRDMMIFPTLKCAA